MSERGSELDVTHYFPHAVGATAAVVGVPVTVMLILAATSSQAPPVLLTAAVGTLLSILLTVAGTSLWNRRPESTQLSFAELMLWSWLRRWRAEQRLAEQSFRLGFDRHGRRWIHPEMSREEQLAVLHRLTAALESKDPYTHGHSRRVERYAYRTALALHLPEHDIDDLRRAAALHDVGKIRVPDLILRKPHGLTSEERAILQDHARAGAELVSEVGNPDVAGAIRHHHERFDGTGYPDGLSGYDIPLFARVIAVVDAYDAMTSTRPYRAGYARNQALDELQSAAGTQFDPEIVEAFLSTLRLPVPLAALVPFLLGGRKAVRELVFFSKRTGAATLGSSAVAAGAAVVIGASMLTPGAVADQPPAPAARPAVDMPAIDVAEREPARAVRAAPRPGTEAKTDEEQVLGTRLARSEQQAEPQKRSGAPESSTEAAPGPAHGDPQPEPKQEPQPEPKQEPQPEPAGEGSRNPNDGNDECPNDGDAGQGNDWDCDARSHPRDRSNAGGEGPNREGD